VRECLSTIPRPVCGWALDLPCGYGRHARLLATLGYQVLCADIAAQRLTTLGKQSRRNGYPLFPIQADAHGALPVAGASLGLVLITDFVASGLLERVAELLVPGGYLLYETFSLRGQNWRGLPRRGDVRGELGHTVETLVYRETPGGPPEERRVRVRAWARRS